MSGKILGDKVAADEEKTKASVLAIMILKIPTKDNFGFLKLIMLFYNFLRTR